MLSKSFGQFLRDERGSYTIWSLIWFLMYVAIGGLAVDLTDAYQKEHQLQAAADASALAGVMSIKAPGEDPVTTARVFAKANMDPDIHGTVLTSDDVRLGTWDFSTERFYTNTTDPNAVYVTTRRAEKNRNPVAMNFLRVLSLLGIPAWWNINTEAVAVRYHPDCTDGFLAGQRVYFRSRTDFYRNFCGHGQLGGVAGRMNNTYETGVGFTHGATSGYDFPSAALSEEDLQAALMGEQDLWPGEAYVVGDYIDVLESLPDGPDGPGVPYSDFVSKPEYEKYQSWEFLYPVDASGQPLPNGKPARATALPNDGVYTPHTVYDIDCNGQLSLGEGVDMTKLAIVSDCRVHSAASFSGGDVILASRHTGGSAAIHMAAKSGLGNPDFCKPEFGGGVQFLTTGDIHMAAQGTWHGVKMIAGGDVDFTSKNDAAWGINVIAGGNIDTRSVNKFGLCPNRRVPGPVEWRYKLVR